MREWISVEERLPEDTLDPAKDTPFKSIKVLVAIKAKNGITVRTQTRFKDTHYPGGEPVTEWKWRFSAGEVTHWMPLPEPPKKSEKPCSSCESTGWDMPQCKGACNESNDYRYYRQAPKEV